MDFELVSHCGPAMYWPELLLWCALFAVVVPLARAWRSQARVDESASLSLARRAPAPPGTSGPLRALAPALIFIAASGLLLSAVGELLGASLYTDSFMLGDFVPPPRPSGFTPTAVIALLAAYAVPGALLALFKKTSRAAAWAASGCCLFAIVLGCRALSMRWSVGLFFGLMPLALLFLHAQARLREEERASLSIRH